MLGMYLQISNELNQDILRYRKFLFGYIDPLYRKTVISMPKIIFQWLVHSKNNLPLLIILTWNLLLFSETLVLFWSIIG